MTEGAIKRELQRLFNLQRHPQQDQIQLRNAFRQLCSDHIEHAQLIVGVFEERQRAISVSNILDDRPQQNNSDEQLVDVMHAIIKDVQGAYVRCFQSKIRFLFLQIWQRSKSKLQRAEELLNT